MTEISEDFKRYLEANYPEDLLKITGADVKEDIITTILSKHERTYQIWKMVPEWIKTLYYDRLPQEVFSGQEPWDKFMLNIEQSVMLKIPYDRTKLTSFVYNSIIEDPESCYEVSQKMEKGGYKFETAVNLQFNSNRRKNLHQTGQLNTPEGKKLWNESRIEDYILIENDWKEHQQEKFVFHKIKEYFRAKTNLNKTILINEEGLTDSEKQKKSFNIIKYTKQAYLAKKDYEAYIDQVKDNELKLEYLKLMSNIEKGVDRRRIFDKIKNLNIRVNAPSQGDKPQTEEEKQIRAMLDETITKKEAQKISPYTLKKMNDDFGIDD